jgi:simple sugar transport system ATP-binding protein
MPNQLVMRGITKRFPGVVANHNVTFEARGGEIHGLLGENGAGKTTLMRILYGMVEADEGVIEISGRQVAISSPRDALALGIGMVHQHFMLVPGMTVAENIALGLRSKRLLLSPLREVESRTGDLVEVFGFNVSPSEVVDDLSVGQRQQVEILKLLYRGAKFLALDEPTAALTPYEWDRLADVLRSLARADSVVILITHKLDEVFGVADRCTVLRDGEVVGSVPIADADKASLARMMVGRPVTLRVVKPKQTPGAPLLEARHLSLVDGAGRLRLSDIDFAVHEGEILGVAGVDGNGQRELVDVLTGLRRPTSGEIRLEGTPFRTGRARAFTAAGGAVIPEDRQRSGLALDMPIWENLIMKEASDPPFSRLGVLSPEVARQHCDDLREGFDIRAPTSDVLMRQLSGGNQQKTVLARELSRNPRILVAAHPTRGLDVGAMEFVYTKILSHREAGGGTLLISHELDEILSLSDRIAVMVEGRFVRIVDAANIDLQALGLLMAGEAVSE